MDYQDNKIFGYVENKTNLDHCFIKVLGYVSRSTWNLTLLNSEESVKEFPSRGKVFAPNFLRKFPHLKGKLILFSVMESNNEGVDEYIWDREGETFIYASSSIEIPKTLDVNNPNSFCEFLLQKKCFESKDEQIFNTQEKLYIVKREDLYEYMITEYDLQLLLRNQPKKIFRNAGYIIVMRSDFEKNPKKIDVMPDSVLQDWITKDFLRDGWRAVINGVSKELENDIFQKLLTKITLPKNVLKDRFKRILGKIEDFRFSYEEVNKFLQYKPVYLALKSTLDQNREKLLEDIRIQCQKKIFDYEQECKSNLETIKNDFINAQEDYKQREAQLKAEFEAKEAEYGRKSFSLEEEFNKKKELQQNQYSELEQEYQFLQNRTDDLKQNIELLSSHKADIVKEYSVIKEVLSMMGTPITPNNGVVSVIPENATATEIEIFYESNTDEPVKSEKEFKERLMFFLENNNRSKDISKKLMALLIYYKVLLFPDIRILNAVLKATGQCKYTLCTVTPEWRSFNKVLESGLKQIIESAHENPGIMHYFVLQNIDMSALPCYFQPIVDVVVGLAPTIIGTKCAFPENLRILTTVSQGEGLPLSECVLRYFGCLENKAFVLDEKEENDFVLEDCPIGGYLSPEFLVNWNKENVTETQYKSYLSIGEDDE